MAPKPKPGHAKRRSTNPVTATYSYDDPAPQTFSFDTSAFAAVTGAPLADSPAAAPVVRPPSAAAAATAPAAAATAPSRTSKLSHLGAEDAAAEKARFVKEHVYACFIKGGMPCAKQPPTGVGISPAALRP
jgi:hypothetical protein